MKTIRQMFIAFVVLCSAGPIRAGNSDLEIHIIPKQVDQSGTQTAGRGTVFHSKEHWTYEVTLENKTFKAMSGLEIKYIIFFKQEKLGTKDAAKPRRQNGSTTIDSLKPREKKAFTTVQVELKKSNLSGDYYYPDNAKERAQDSLWGVWVRVYQNGQQLAEYANPSTLIREQWQ